MFRPSGIARRQAGSEHVRQGHSRLGAAAHHKAHQLPREEPLSSCCQPGCRRAVVARACVCPCPCCLCCVVSSQASLSLSRCSPAWLLSELTHACVAHCRLCVLMCCPPRNPHFRCRLSVDRHLRSFCMCLCCLIVFAGYLLFVAALHPLHQEQRDALAHQLRLQPSESCSIDDCLVLGVCCCAPVAAHRICFCASVLGCRSSTRSSTWACWRTSKSSGQVRCSAQSRQPASAAPPRSCFCVAGDSARLLVPALLRQIQ